MSLPLEAHTWVTEGTHFEVWVGGESLPDIQLSFRIMKRWIYLFPLADICSPKDESCWFVLSQHSVASATTNSNTEHVWLNPRMWKREHVLTRSRRTGGAYYNADTVWTEWWKSARRPRVRQQCHQWADQCGCGCGNMEWQQGQTMEIKVMELFLFSSLWLLLSTRATDEYRVARRLSSLVSDGTNSVFYHFELN